MCTNSIYPNYICVWEQTTNQAFFPGLLQYTFVRRHPRTMSSRAGNQCERRGKALCRISDDFAVRPMQVISSMHEEAGCGSHHIKDLTLDVLKQWLPYGPCDDFNSLDVISASDTFSFPFTVAIMLGKDNSTNRTTLRS